MDELGRVPWDRFQTLCGIQYYFDTEFQLLRGHMLYAGTEWALSSINQQGFWEKQPILGRDGYVSVLSVDIGDFNSPSSHLVDESGRGKAARDCTPDEIAAEVWRQIVSALTSNDGSLAEKAMPWPAWYALDRGLRMAQRTRSGPGPRGCQRDAVPRSHRRGLEQSAQQRPLEPARELLDYRTARAAGGSKISSSGTSGKPATAAIRCTTIRWSSRARGTRRSPG